MPNAAPPTTNNEVISRYTTLRDEHQHAQDALGAKRARVLQGLVAVFAVLGYLVFGSMRSTLHVWPLLAGFVAIAFAIWYALRASGEVTREQRLVGFYERNLRRVDGSETQSGRTGTDAGNDLRPAGHLYEHDLDLLGPDSLFGLLCTVRTGPGERGLARYLLEPATHAETLARQEAVKELLPQLELREKISLLGNTRFQQISGGFFDGWIAEAPPVFSAVFRPLLIVTALASIALLLVGLTHIWPWSQVLQNLALTLGIQGAISGYLRSRVTPILEAGARLQQHIKLFAEGLALVQAAHFTSPKLAGLQQQAMQPAGAVAALSKLESQLAIVEQRPKEYFLLLSLLTAAGTQAAISIAAWKRQYAESMKIWLACWSEFEALNAIATYAFEHPEDVWPELLPLDAPPRLAGEAVGHPLLAGAVTNDILLGTEQRFYLISGSNMAGKSTLLRSIGVNAVLAYAGAPVRASSFALTPLALGASLALTDSLAEGKSKFKAEVERLSAIVRLARDRPVLFLVDEIFSGTNSADRRTAADAVLSRLLERGAIGALSTHDLALTELATPDNAGSNVHMASPDPADPLGFDYRLKPGVNTSSNALAIVRMMGLD